jgi:hypothetical protein
VARGILLRPRPPAPDIEVVPDDGIRAADLRTLFSSGGGETGQRTPSTRNALLATDGSEKVLGGGFELGAKTVGLVVMVVASLSFTKPTRSAGLEPPPRKKREISPQPSASLRIHPHPFPVRR